MSWPIPLRRTLYSDHIILMNKRRETVNENWAVLRVAFGVF